MIIMLGMRGGRGGRGEPFTCEILLIAVCVTILLSFTSVVHIFVWCSIQPRFTCPNLEARGRCGWIAFRKLGYTVVDPLQNLCTTLRMSG